MSTMSYANHRHAPVRTARRHDASDADADVVRRQVARVQPPGDWARLDATSDAETTQGRLREALAGRGIHAA